HQQDAEEGEEEEDEEPLGEERPEVAEAVEVAEHVREQQEASDPEEGHEPAHRRGAQPATADDVPQREEPRPEERDERHAGPLPPAPRMPRKTSSSDAELIARPSSAPARARSSSSVPTTTSRPPSMMPMRPQSSSATARLCVERKIVTPSAARPRTRRRSSSTPSGSSPTIGSSRTRTRGRCTRA